MRAVSFHTGREQSRAAGASQVVTSKTIYPITAQALQRRIHARYPQYDLVDLPPDTVIPTPTTDLTLRCRKHGVEFPSRPAYLLQQRAAKACFCHICEPCGKRTYYPQMLHAVLAERCRQPLVYVDDRYGQYQLISKWDTIRVECRAPLPDGTYCGHRWQARISNLLSGYGCRKCYDRSVRARAISPEALNLWLPRYGLRADARECGQVVLRCPSGHRFRVALDRVQRLRQAPATRTARRRMCPACKHRLAYFAHRREATRKGLRLDAHEAQWQGRTRHYTYRCVRGHVHRRTPAGLAESTNGCPTCRAEAKRRQLLKEVKAMVVERGGVLMPGQTYENCGQKLACRCADGHLFRISRDKLRQGGWCPVCSSGFGERLTRHVMEHIFGVPFPKCRPDFLRNHKTGRPLELDGYNARLGIAIEYQGQHHKRRIHGWHRTERAFSDMVERDALKRRLARAYGVRLVVVDQLDPGMSLAEVFAAIEKACRTAGVGIPPYDRRLGLAPVYRGNTNRVRFERLVRDKGGTQQEPYVGLHRRVRLACGNPDHPVWRTTPFSVLYAGTWCPRCAAEAIGASVRERHARRVRDWSELHGAELLDESYRGSRHRHRWRCAAGHVVVAPYGALASRTSRGRHWCSACAAATSQPS